MKCLIKKMRCFQKSFAVSISLFILSICSMAGAHAQNVNTLNSETQTLMLSFVPFNCSESKNLYLDWNPSWFDTPSTVYNHGIARFACFLSDAAYDITNPSCIAVQKAYESLGARDVYLNYDIDYKDDELGIDQCAFSFATVELTDGSPLVFIVIRGTPLGVEEWISNLNINNSHKNNEKIHEGFRKVRSIVMEVLYNYLKEHRINLKKAKFLITGHSRGAAVSNLIGYELAGKKGFNTDNIYVYTFASPNVTLETDTSDTKYNFIWNIINAEDAVPTLPLYYDKWTYSKYGHVRVLANAWNAGRDKYYNDIYPRVSELHRYLKEKDYSPFGTGPYIPIQVSSMLAMINPDPESFYDSLLSLHKPMEMMVSKTFAPEKKEKKRFTDKMLDKYNESHDCIVDKIMLSIDNMHACETYLSFLLTLEEDECFFTDGCIQLILNGPVEAAIMNSDGEILIHLSEGQTSISSQKLPLAANSLFFDKTSIGFPIDEDFTVVLTRTSSIPSPVDVIIEFYDAQGHLLRRKENHEMNPHKLLVYEFQAGKSIWDNGCITLKEVHGKNRSELLEETKLYSTLRKNLLFEVDLDTDYNLGMGMSYGTQILYGLVLFRTPLNKGFGMWEIDPGIGVRDNVWDCYYFSAELFGKCVFIPDGTLRESSKVFAFVPSVKFSLGYQPFRRTSFFIAASADLSIDGFNNAAFEARNMNIHGIDMGNKAQLVPAFSFGMKF